MSRLLCCCVILLASPAAAEFLVQEGDYYEHLSLFDTGFESVRITGGRVDVLAMGGDQFPLTIEGGSIGAIENQGNLNVVFRTGDFQLDTPITFDQGPMGDSDAMMLYFDDVYTMGKSQLQSSQWKYVAWFSDFTYSEIMVADNPLNPGTVPIDFPTFIDKPLGDTQGDGLVDLTDLNNVRNLFGGDGSGLANQGDANNDGDVDLDDLNAIRNNFGMDYRISSNPVPEPTGLALLLSGTLAFLLATKW